MAPRPASKLLSREGLLAQMKAWNEETVNTPSLFKVFFVALDTCVSKDCNQSISVVVARTIQTDLRVGQFPALEARHVAPQPELLAVQPLQVLLPLDDLVGDLLAGVGVAYHALLHLGHVLELVILKKVIQVHFW